MGLLCCPSIKVQILAQFSCFTVAQFSCCTSTKVQILAQFACFTSTKVQRLTRKLAGDEVEPRTHAPNKTLLALLVQKYKYWHRSWQAMKLHHARTHPIKPRGLICCILLVITSKRTLRRRVWWRRSSKQRCVNWASICTFILVKQIEPVSSYYCIFSVLILLYLCPHTTQYI